MASRLRIAVGGVEKDADTGVRGDDGGKGNAVPKGGDEGTAFESVSFSSSSIVTESTGSMPAIERQCRIGLGQPRSGVGIRA